MIIVIDYGMGNVGSILNMLKKIGDLWNIGALAHFLETKTDANVLATPNMVSLDNEEAKIVVGANVPFVTGSFTYTMLYILYPGKIG